MINSEIANRVADRVLDWPLSDFLPWGERDGKWMDHTEIEKMPAAEQVKHGCPAMRLAALKGIAMYVAIDLVHEAYPTFYTTIGGNPQDRAVAAATLRLALPPILDAFDARSAPLGEGLPGAQEVADRVADRIRNWPLRNFMPWAQRNGVAMGLDEYNALDHDELLACGCPAAVLAEMIGILPIAALRLLTENVCTPALFGSDTINFALRDNQAVNATERLPPVLREYFANLGRQ